MPKKTAPSLPPAGTLVRYCGRDQKRARNVRVLAEASGGCMVVEAVGRAGKLVRLTVKQSNLFPKQPDLFDQGLMAENGPEVP